MATGKPPKTSTRRGWALGLLAVGAVAVGSLYLPGETVAGYAEAGTSYGAKNACSCRHIAGRDLDSCKTDFLPGMEAVFLSEDADEKSVTAYVPLIASNTAYYREGFGCVLDAMED